MIQPNFRESVEKFLYDQLFLPLTSNNNAWNSLTIQHYKNAPSPEVQNTHQLLIKDIPSDGGVYAYINSEKELLYIGKSANIRTRVWSHYRESFTKLSGDRTGVWNKFFASHAGELTVLWRTIDDDRLRRCIEEMIEVINKSIFEIEYPRGKRKLHVQSE